MELERARAETLASELWEEAYRGIMLAWGVDRASLIRIVTRPKGS